MEVLEQYGVNLTQAVATGVANFGISYVISSDKMVRADIMPIAKMAAVSAGSELVSALVADQLVPTLMGMSSMDGATLRMYAGPVLSGVIYSFVTDSVVQNLDNRGFMEKFLSQVGASVAAGYVMAPAYYKQAQ